MSSLFKKAADSLRSGPMVIPIFLAFVLLGIIGFGLSIEDATTSYFGYLMLPTRKANDWVAYLVAIMPSIGMICFGYVAFDDWRKSWARWVTLMLLVADVGTDVLYMSQDRGEHVWLVAIAESLIIYVVLTELSITVSIGMLVALYPDFDRQLSSLWQRVNRSRTTNVATDTFLYDSSDRDIDDDGDNDLDDLALRAAAASRARPPARPPQQTGFGAMDATARDRR